MINKNCSEKRIFSTKNIKVFNPSKAICNIMKRKHHRQFSQIVINVEQDHR